ncbi:PH domain-containing protein [Brachybacterium sp. EF45031]|nr:PH domain-containing protein [Brachybacterium sillae]
MALVVSGGPVSAPNRVLYVLFGAAIFWFCHREASVAVTARPDELVVRNLFTTRRLAWAQVVGVSFPAGDPWAHLDLADGETLSTMALQRTDGDLGITQARRLARLVQERGTAAVDS